MQAKAVLMQGLQALKLNVDEHSLQQLLDFVALLEKWNQRMNLTAVRNPVDMVRRHIFDSLAILPYLHGDHIIDVGTGAGIPGIPLSIVCPDKTFFLLDGNQKKQVFVSQAINVLSLKNAQGVHSMVQTYQPSQKFSTILTRAFAPLEHMIPLTTHLLAEKGQFLAMMGKAQSEIQLPLGYKMEKMIVLQVPLENAQRHLAIIERLSN